MRSPKEILRDKTIRIVETFQDSSLSRSSLPSKLPLKGSKKVEETWEQRCFQWRVGHFLE